MKTGQAKESVHVECAAELAGELFDQGFNCTNSVLQATTGSTDQKLLSITAGFGCGIGNSGCICGAVTGGVMALGLKGYADRSGELMVAFKDAFQTTCCRGLSKKYRWMSEEHLANCRKITVTTASIVEDLQRNTR